MTPGIPTAPRVLVGVIGCGRIACEHDIPGVLRSGLAEVVSVCDVDANRLAGAKALVESSRPAGASRNAPVATHHDCRALLHDPAIDAVVISTPDHWHAAMALAAVRAGKHVYLQKPMTMTIEEGIRLRDEAARSASVVQVGSQQRSMPQFRQACELVRSGRVGRLERIEIGLPADPSAPDSPEQPVPGALNYDAWLGPAAFGYYTEQRVHPPSGYGRPGWLRNESHCLGMITGWGSHHFDIAHWAMDLELSGPGRVEAVAEFPKNSIWNVHGSFTVELQYPGGIRMTVSDRFPNGIRFIGDDGWIFVTRDAPATASDPFRRSGDLKPLDASRPGILDFSKVSVQLPRSTDHHRNWLDCVVSRSTPLSPPPVAHRSNTACIVSWIAMKLGRSVEWDARGESFSGDAEADSLTRRAKRPPYDMEFLTRI